MAQTLKHVSPPGAGAKDGSSPENAWASIADFIATNPMGNVKCLCNADSGGESPVAQLTLASSGTGQIESERVEICGVASDWTTPKLYPINSTGLNNGIAFNSKAFWRISYLQFSGATYDGILLQGTNNIVDHCKVVTPARYGLYTFNGTYNHVYNLIVSNPTDFGINDANLLNTFFAPYVYGGSSTGIKLASQNSVVIGGLVRDNNQDNIDCSLANCWVYFTVCHGSIAGSGIKFAHNANMVFVGNSLTENNQYGLEGTGTTEKAWEDYNGLRGNGVSERSNCPFGPNSFTFPTDPYTNEVANNFTRAGSSQTAAKSIAVALDWDAGTPVNYIYVPAGLIPGDAGGGGGGLLLNSGMLSA